MRYVAVDIETTGLREDCQVLQVGAIIDQGGKLDRLPRFDFKIKRDWYCGEPFALSMHSKLFRQLAAPLEDNNVDMFKHYVIGDDDELARHYKNWLDYHGVDYMAYNVAGKNYAAFDSHFLRQISGWPLGRHRVIDPGNLYLRKTDEALPDMKECCKRAGIVVDMCRAHDALYDCEIVVRLVRAWGEMSA